MEVRAGKEPEGSFLLRTMQKLNHCKCKASQVFVKAVYVVYNDKTHEKMKQIGRRTGGMKEGSCLVRLMKQGCKYGRTGN